MNAITPIQRLYLDAMFTEVIDTFDNLIKHFYEDHDINIAEVDITNDDYMNELVVIAFETYINHNDYEETYNDMNLWEDSVDKPSAFGIAVWYITTTLRRITVNYTIPIVYFRDVNEFKSLFQYAYFSDNRDVVKQSLIYAYTNIIEAVDENIEVRQ